MAVSGVKLSTRIYFQQIIVVLALIGLGIYSLNNLRVINDYASELADDDFPVMLLSLDVIEKANEEAHDLLIMTNAAMNLAADNVAELQEKKADYESAKVEYLESDQALSEAFEKLEAKIQVIMAVETEAEMLALLKELSDEIATIKEMEGSILLLSKNLEQQLANGKQDEVQETLAQIYAADEEVDRELKKLIKFSQDDIKRSLDNSKSTSNDMVDALYLIVISVSLFAIILTIITGMSLRTLRKSVDVISGSVQQVATAAAQSGNAISMVSDGAKRQSDSINQAVTAVEQSVTVLAEVSKSAEEATELAKNAGVLVRTGKEKMDAMVRVVNRIEENSNKVNKITEIISGIASQTNMLALNAAIEAARAGEQGKGFAVVADQVKNLAENSKSSVDDIVTLIEQAKADASEAVQVANNVNQEMEKILDSARTTERMMQNISTAMEEQVSTTEELGQNMDTLRDIGTSNANAAEEITETIIELSRIASDTNQEIKKFNI